MFQFIRLVLYVFPLPGSLRPQEPSIEVDLIRVKKGDPAADQLAKALDPNLVQRRLDRGEICFAAIHEGNIISYCWMSASR